MLKSPMNSKEEENFHNWNKWPLESVMGWNVYPQKEIEVLIPVITEFDFI